jgi:hypothetical protein
MALASCQEAVEVEQLLAHSPIALEVVVRAKVVGLHVERLEGAEALMKGK